MLKNIVRDESIVERSSTYFSHQIDHFGRELFKWFNISLQALISFMIYFLMLSLVCHRSLKKTGVVLMTCFVILICSSIANVCFSPTHSLCISNHFLSFLIVFYITVRFMIPFRSCNRYLCWDSNPCRHVHFSCWCRAVVNSINSMLDFM